MALAPKLAAPAKKPPLSKKAETAIEVKKPAGPVALSKTDKFRPWFRELESELREVGIEVIRSTTGDLVDSDMSDDDREAHLEELRKKERMLGPAGFEAEHMADPSVRGLTEERVPGSTVAAK